MDFDATIDLIIKELREASDIIDDLKRYPEVPLLQVELAKMKCKSAGEVIALLKNSREYPKVAAKEPQAVKKIVKPAPVQEEEPLIIEDTPLPAPAPALAPTLAPTPTPTPTPAPAPLTASEPVTAKKRKKEHEAATLAEQFTDDSGSFYEKLAAEKNEEELAEVLKAKPITSLTEAIGLNDRFLFIREIFKGNQNDYTQAITRLENVNSVADARAVIMSYTGDNSESEVVMELIDLVKRKLAANE